MTAFLLLLPWIPMGFLVWSYRRRFLKAIQQRDAAESKACKALDEAKDYEGDADYYRSLLGFKKAPVAFPSHHPIGTLSNPVLTPCGDSAVYCSLADLMTGGKT